MQEITLGELVRPLPKGQITIPVKYRKKLGIDKNTWLSLFLKDDGIFVRPVKVIPKDIYTEDDIEIYSDKRIKEFMKADKLDKKARQIAKKFLFSKNK